MCNARRYSQHVSQSPDDCEGCVTTRITNFTAKAFTWPRVEEINREADIFEGPRKSKALHLLLDFLYDFYTSVCDSITIAGKENGMQLRKMGRYILSNYCQASAHTIKLGVSLYEVVHD